MSLKSDNVKITVYIYRNMSWICCSIISSSQKIIDISSVLWFYEPRYREYANDSCRLV